MRGWTEDALVRDERRNSYEKIKWVFRFDIPKPVGELKRIELQIIGKCATYKLYFVENQTLYCPTNAHKL